MAPAGGPACLPSGSFISMRVICILTGGHRLPPPPPAASPPTLTPFLSFPGPCCPTPKGLPARGHPEGPPKVLNTSPDGTHGNDQLVPKRLLWSSQSSSEGRAGPLLIGEGVVRTDDTVPSLGMFP